MKRKYLITIIVLVILFFLTGCAGPTIYPGSDEVKIESVIEEYFIALNNQNWSKAKNCCVYGSEFYNATCKLEDEVDLLKIICNYVILDASVDVIDISITGDYAYVICYASITLSACGYTENENEYAYANLNKIGNNWKLF